MTFGDYIKGLKVEAVKKNMDFAYAVLWQVQEGDNTPAEVDVRWLEPGKYLTTFPGPTTQAQKDANQFWDKSWVLVRCAVQPVTEQRISIPAGKFIPGGLPDIKFDA